MQGQAQASLPVRRYAGSRRRCPPACSPCVPACPPGCRPGLQDRARYYAVVFLNQLVLSHRQAAQPTAGKRASRAWGSTWRAPCSGVDAHAPKPAAVDEGTPEGPADAGAPGCAVRGSHVLATLSGARAHLPLPHAPRPASLQAAACPSGSSTCTSPSSRWSWTARLALRRRSGHGALLLCVRCARVLSLSTSWPDWHANAACKPA